MNEWGIRETNILQALQNEKKRLSKEIHKSQSRITDSTRKIFEPVPKTGSRLMSVTNLVSNSVALYQGLRMGTGLIRAVSTMLRRRRR